MSSPSTQKVRERFQEIRHFFEDEEWEKLSNYQRQRSLNLYKNHIMMCELMHGLDTPEAPNFVRHYNVRMGLERSRDSTTKNPSKKKRKISAPIPDSDQRSENERRKSARILSQATETMFSEERANFLLALKREKCGLVAPLERVCTATVSTKHGSDQPCSSNQQFPDNDSGCAVEKRPDMHTVATIDPDAKIFSPTKVADHESSFDSFYQSCINFVKPKRKQIKIEEICCPENVELKYSKSAKFGIRAYAKDHVDNDSLFGPYSSTLESYLVEEGILETDSNVKIRGKNEEFCKEEQWIKFVRRVYVRDNVNLVPFRLMGQLFFVSSEIRPGAELSLFCSKERRNLLENEPELCQMAAINEDYTETDDVLMKNNAELAQNCLKLTENTHESTENKDESGQNSEQSADGTPGCRNIVEQAEIQGLSVVCFFCEERFCDLMSLNEHICPKGPKLEEEKIKEMEKMENKVIRSPSGAKTYVCLVCNKHNASPWKLRRHQASHQAIKSAICWACGKQVSDKSHLKEHQMSYCKKLQSQTVLWKKEAFEQWKKRSAKAEKLENENEMLLLDGNCSKSWRCNVCAQTFVRKFSLVRHMECIHMEAKKYFVCGKCSKSFTRQDVYKIHSCSQKNHGGRRPTQKIANFQCELCDMTFQLVSERTRHMKLVHWIQGEHKCESCEKCYFVKAHLIRHQKETHSEDAQIFRCKKCHLEFFRRDNLSRHLSSEAHRLGVKPKMFQCECGLEFEFKNKWRIHLRKEHDMSDEEVKSILDQHLDRRGRPTTYGTSECNDISPKKSLRSLKLKITAK